MTRGNAARTEQLPLASPALRRSKTEGFKSSERCLSDALAECDARGWNALPLAPREMAKLFPALWDTKKAAERWIAKNPPEAIRDMIRVWGVLNSYRPQGQTRWSRALVRHGAEAREALAAVLRVPAEDVGVSDLTEL
jgi:hypothetical protein